MSITGRPKKVDEAGHQVLREIVEAQPMATVNEIRLQFEARTGITVHRATLSKALKAAGLKREIGKLEVSAEAEPKPRYGYQSQHRRLMPEQQYPSCLTDAEWALVSDLFDRTDSRGVPPTYSRRLLVDACCFVVRTGCSWRMLPSDFPPWQNVYASFRRWVEQEKFEQMHDRLRAQWRIREGRAPAPTAAVLDAQSTRHSPQGGPKGFDAGKKVKGRKRNLVVDTLGLLLAVTVVAANVQDRDAAPDVVAQSSLKYPTLQKLYVDGGYAGQCAVALATNHQLDVEVVRHPANRNVGRWTTDPQSDFFAVPADASGFVVLPKRWVVERTHAWLERSRRLVMHHDRRIDVSEAWAWLAAGRMLARRLTT